MGVVDFEVERPVVVGPRLLRMNDRLEECVFHVDSERVKWDF